MQLPAASPKLPPPRLSNYTLRFGEPGRPNGGTAMLHHSRQTQPDRRGILMKRPHVAAAWYGGEFCLQLLAINLKEPDNWVWIRDRWKPRVLNRLKIGHDLILRPCLNPPSSNSLMQVTGEQGELSCRSNEDSVSIGLSWFGSTRGIAAASYGFKVLEFYTGESWIR